MYNPDDLPRCPACGVIRTPGAPMCTSCWIGFDDEPAPVREPVSAPDVVAPAPEPVLSPAGASMVLPPWELPAQREPSPQLAPVGWTPPPPVAAPLMPPPPARNLGRIVLAAAVGLLLLVVGGGYLVFRSTADSEKSLIAERFTSGRPPSMMPAVPDFTSGLFDEPEVAGEAAAFMATTDPQVRTANAAMVDLQKTLDKWAHDKADDDAVRAGIAAFLDSLKPFGITAMGKVPSSLGRGVGKLQRAAYEYEMALGSLQDWLDAGNPSAKTTFSLMVGSANVLWDEGLIVLYRNSDYAQPKLPHPPAKK